MDILADGAARQRRQGDAGASPGVFDSVCDEIKEDMHKMEEDSKTIDCYAITNSSINLVVRGTDTMPLA
jgi:hypothetical protein